MYRLYLDPESGNCYKPRLLMTHLGIPHKIFPVNVLDPATRPHEVRKGNPSGRVPVLALPDGKLLAESNAMLCYLGEGTSYFPTDRFDRALCLQWMFFEQNLHEPNVASLRYWVHLRKEPDHPDARHEHRMQAGLKALDAVEEWLEKDKYFVPGAYTIADIALYAYTHVAHEAGFPMEKFPAIEKWIARVEKQPGFVPMREPAAT